LPGFADEIILDHKVQNLGEFVSRTKAFRVDTAVDRAMELFWLQGYGATSLHDLLRKMRIGRQSLYDTFESKRNLYLRALDRYTALVVQHALAGMEGPSAGPADVRAFFRRLVASQRGTPALGCLMVGAAQELATTDREVALRVDAHRARMRAAFQNALTNEVPPAELPAITVQLAALADALLIAARSGAESRALGAIADVATKLATTARPYELGVPY